MSSVATGRFAFQRGKERFVSELTEAGLPLLRPVWLSLRSVAYFENSVGSGKAACTWVIDCRRASVYWWKHEDSQGDLYM